MDYSKPDIKAVKSWRIGQAIGFAITFAIAAGIFTAAYITGWDGPVRIIVEITAIGLSIYALIGMVLFPKLEYMQWGYKVEEDRVVIRHGIFFIKESVIPVIRIQSITVSQGPINRRFGLFNVEIALASGTFEIEGLTRETADTISENLKARLYTRIAEKGVL